MNKNKRTTLDILLMIVVLVITIPLALNCEKKKENPFNRKNNQENRTENVVYPSTKEYIQNGVATFFCDNDPYLISFSKIKQEFLGYQIIDEKDILQSGLDLNSFYEVFNTNWTIWMIDYPKLKKDNPQLYNDFVNYYKMNKDEKEEFEEVFYDTIYNYEKEVHPNTKYIFVKCRFTNTDLCESCLFYLSNLKLEARQEPDTRALYMDLAYFDKSCNTEGIDRLKNYYTYELAPQEVLNCMIGFRLYSTLDWIDIEKCSLYFGYLDLKLVTEFEDGRSDIGPEYGEYMFNIRDLVKYE